MSRYLIVLMFCSVALIGCNEKDSRGRNFVPATDIAGESIPGDLKNPGKKAEFNSDGLELLGIELYKGSVPAPGTKEVFRNSQVEGDHYAVTMLAAADLATLRKFFKSQLTKASESEIEIPEYDKDFKSLGNKPFLVITGLNKEGNKVFVNISTSMAQGKTKYGIDTLHAVGMPQPKHGESLTPELP